MYTRDKFAQSNRLSYIVVGTEFQPDDSVDFIAPVTGGYDHGYVRTRADLAEQVETVLLAEANIQEYYVRLAG